MNIPMQARVYCTDGYYGCSSCILLHHKSRRVTQVVVKESKGGIERMVPLGFVKDSTPDAIYLSCDIARARRFETFRGQEYVTEGETSGVRISRSVIPDQNKAAAVTYEKIPPGELGLRLGAGVNAKDGKVGTLNQLAVDPRDGQITHLVLQEGQIWSKKEATVDISQVEDIREKAVFLKLSKREVSQLPAVAVKRRKKDLAG